MIIWYIILSGMSLYGLSCAFNAWIRPIIVERMTFEPGRDDEVSWREMWRRSAWRHTDGVSRFLSSAFLLIIVLAWFLTVK
jgi:hypothetical protein